MRNFSTIARTIVLGGVVVFLQTSCSKEQSQSNADAAKKSGYTSLSREKAEILAFKDAYQDHVDGEPATFQTLTVDDAEWLLEAALNEAHQVPGLADPGTASLSYTEETPFSVSTSTTVDGDEVMISSSLFSAFGTLMTKANAYEDMLPMSDIEIILGSGDFVLHGFMARLDDRFRFGNASAIPYNASFASVAAVVQSGPISTQTCGSTIPSFEALEHNLALAYDPAAVSIVSNSGGIYVNVKRHDFGNNLSYVGRGPGNYDYSGYLWGDPTDGFSNGSLTQCIDANNTTSDPSMTEYEDGIKNTLIPQEKEMSQRSVYGIEISPSIYTYPDASIWHHHVLKFRTAMYLP
ncbi:hypothetical protein [Owenweeksia hongkongensis]|uniref:hypothetical protein n=1 Tax=Owenweeksia hongkongensis TaxID=253245 RepID=UPI003A958216